MNRTFVKSLQFKVIVAIFAAMLFFGTLATFIVWARVRTDLIDEQNNSVAAEADEQSHEIAEIFRNSAFLARAVAQFPAIISALSTKSFDSESVSRELEHFNLGSRYASIYVMDATGKTIASTDRSFINNNYGFRKYFLDAIQGKEGFLIAIGVTTKEPGYYFSAPVMGPDGSVIGVGVVKLKPDSIIESLSRTSLTRFGKIMMVNDDGIVIYSDKPDRLYRSLGQLSMADMQRITASKDFENTNITPLQYGQVYQAIKNYSEEITVSFYDQVEKEEEYLTVARVDNFNAYLVTEIGLTKLDAMARTAATTVAAMLVLIGIAMMAAIYLLLTRFLHPLEDLQRFARLVSAGSLGERLTINTGDELQVLAESFNNMAQNIEESYEQLEQKIQVQTTDISKKGFEIEDMKKSDVQRS